MHIEPEFDNLAAGDHDGVVAIRTKHTEKQYAKRPDFPFREDYRTSSRRRLPNLLDEYWDEIAGVSINDVELVPLFRKALGFETSFVKHFALAALDRIGVPRNHYWEELKLLLLDEG